MNQLEGYKHAMQSGKFDKHDYKSGEYEFYQLFKDIARIKDNGLNWNDKALLTMVLSYELRGLEFYHSNNSICYELGMSLDQVKKSITRLKGAGYIKVYKFYEGLICKRRTMETQTFEVNRSITESHNYLVKKEV